MRYDEAVAQARSGKAVVVSYAGGWKRWAKLRVRADGSVAAMLHTTDILVWHKDGRIIARTGGWKTATTIEALNNLLNGSYLFYRQAHVLYVRGVPFEEGMDVAPLLDRATA